MWLHIFLLTECGRLKIGQTLEQICRTISASSISLIQMWNINKCTAETCAEIWHRSGSKLFHSLLPFVSESLEPVEALQPAWEGQEALLNVAILFFFIICLLQQQQCVCVGVSLKCIVSEKNKNCEEDHAASHIVKVNGNSLRFWIN